MDKDKKISQLAASGGIGGGVILDGEELIPFSKRGADGVWTNGAMTASRLAALARAEIDETIVVLRRKLNVLEARIKELENPGSGMEGGMI